MQGLMLLKRIPLESTQTYAFPPVESAKPTISISFVPPFPSRIIDPRLFAWNERSSEGPRLKNHSFVGAPVLNSLTNFKTLVSCNGPAFIIVL